MDATTAVSFGVLPPDRTVEELLRTPLAQVRTQVGGDVEDVYKRQSPNFPLMFRIRVPASQMLRHSGKDRS